ncbi:5-hydroxytryptamine receptor 6-like [Octopus sinensis]|uniref:5-hydroxytryptamine receptor 6-like n=1 Tax=Octopus sinensis TaxID=2607531 RepID=A0A6P7TAJ3_9MOLL|nr:5-hydroxytryptamine receptor 6-like [Octopus sinensis]
MVITDIKDHSYYIYGIAQPPAGSHLSGRSIFLICLTSPIISLCSLIIVALSKDWSKYWNPYRKCLLGVLFTSLIFGIVSLCIEAYLESNHGKWNLGANFCILWHALSRTIQDAANISMICLNIDRCVSLLKPQVYMSKCYEYGIHISLLSMAILSALINLIVMFLNFNNAHHDTRDNDTCHLLQDILFPYFSLFLLVLLLSSAIALVASTSKTKFYPSLKMDDKHIGCVMPILLTDFSIVFLCLVPRIVQVILISNSSGVIIPYHYTVETLRVLNYADWSSFVFLPFLLLFDANIIKSIKNIFSCKQRSRKFDL